jgi:ATP-binding protein involved in chromosome partitioning
MAQNVNLEVKGVIENMSWFTGDDNKRYYIFGHGGGKDLADRLEVPLLGQIPLVQELREGSDSGNPITAINPDSEAGRIFAEIVETIDVELAPTKRYNEGLKLLQ